MSNFPLTVKAGTTALQQIAESGWKPELFGTLVGASGGAKLLGIAHLDRFLFGNYLQRSQHAMELYGSSIGSWRHAALAADEPLNAIITLQERYLNQRWDEHDKRSPREIVDALCDWVLDGFCTPPLQSRICDHRRFTTHIVTARGRGLNNHTAGVRLGTGMMASAMSNAVTRRTLGFAFQRVVFSSGSSEAFQFRDFDTMHVPLTPQTVRPALVASGSIPFLMSGESDIPGAPKGQYWDGGIVDYHFDFSNFQGEGLVLYPHFTDRVIPGWFDKPLPWRRSTGDLLDRVVILAPSKDYLARLPFGKIPDRKDFNRMSQPERLDYWQKAMEASRELAEAFDQVISDTDPLKRVSPFNHGQS
ncbi:MAG: patatin-like phospholipase family protein [Pseudomonadales bacterium]|nr:patatin-like phospholipase family protein [Pseudomonadales bacterium]